MKRIGACLLLLTTAAASAKSRDLCPTRPGLDTPSCTVDAGHVLVELGLVDWTLQRGDGTRSDTVATGELLARYGLDDRTEIQLGWTAFTHVRQRDVGGVSVDRGTGDVAATLKRSVAGANGPIAVQAYVSAPTGNAGIGAGGWQAGVLLPVSIDAGHGLGLAVTPRIDWLANATDDRHHLAYGSAFGMSEKFGAVTLAVEGSVVRDDDPAGRTTPMLSSVSLAWQPDDDSQLDVGAVKGVSDAPDIELYVGISRRF